MSRQRRVFVLEHLHPDTFGHVLWEELAISRWHLVEPFFVVLVELHRHHSSKLVFDEAAVRGQDVTQSNKHGFVHQQHAGEFAGLVHVWHCEQAEGDVLIVFFLNGAR